MRSKQSNLGDIKVGDRVLLSPSEFRHEKVMCGEVVSIEPPGLIEVKREGCTTTEVYRMDGSRVGKSYGCLLCKAPDEKEKS